MRNEIAVFKEEPLTEATVTLSGRDYRLRTDYNGREDRWYLYLFDADGVLVSGPMRVRPGIDLLRKVRWKTSCPAGALIAFDLSGTAESPGAAPSWAEYGRRVRLFYDDLEAA